MSKLEKNKLENEINFRERKKITSNFVFNKKAFTLWMETKKIIEYEWPKEVINSEEAKWFFYPTRSLGSSRELSKDDMNEYKDKIFVDGKWVKRNRDLHVVYTGKHPGLFNYWEEYTEYKEGKKPVEKEVDIYHLISYTKNDLGISTPYLAEIDEIDSSQFKLRNKESWKRELDWFASLLSSKQLEFDNEETKKAFFQEYNNWASK